MAAAGILKQEDRVELIEGEITTMMPIGPWHSRCTARLLRALIRAYSSSAIVSTGPLNLADGTEPVPDVMVLRWRDDEYGSAHPQPADVLLLIEVSDTSRNFDLGRKRALYAGAGIAEYWVADGSRQCVHVFRGPVQGEYSESMICSGTESLALPHCPGSALAVNEMGVAG